MKRILGILVVGILLTSCGKNDALTRFGELGKSLASKVLGIDAEVEKQKKEFEKVLQSEAEKVQAEIDLLKNSLEKMYEIADEFYYAKQVLLRVLETQRENYAELKEELEALEADSEYLQGVVSDYEDRISVLEYELEQFEGCERVGFIVLCENNGGGNNGKGKGKKKGHNK